jgi:hypothetical protein
MAGGSASRFRGLIFAADRLWPLPLKEVNPARVVVDEKGTPLWRFADSDGIWRYPVTIEEVSPRYLEALIQYEDRWFWDHPGVNPLSVLRAAWQDLSSGKVISGGSTLTMQVARLLDPHPRTFGGKIRQLWRAMQLEWHLSKREILTLYLNRAPLAVRCRAWERQAGRIWASRRRSSAIPTRRCWRCCRRHRVDYARTAGLNGPKRRAIKCSTAWRRRASGPQSRSKSPVKNQYGWRPGRCRSWRRSLLG